MATSEELYEKARKLDALAEDVDTCVDGAKRAATGSSWHCDNATEVRGKLDTYQSSARTAADGIRDEARTVRHQAHAAAEREAADARADAADHPHGPGRAAV